MNVRYRVELSQTEREQLKGFLSGGKRAARKLKRAQILLAADAGASDDEIATSVGVGGSTVYRTKQRFVLGNLEAALNEAPRPGASRKLTGRRPVKSGESECPCALIVAERRHPVPPCGRRQRSESVCIAEEEKKRPDVRFGSFAPVSGWVARPSMSAAPPIPTENSRRSCSSRCAISRLSAVRQEHRYSMTSSARSRKLSGIVSPIAFAVRRLIARTNLVGC